MTILLLPKTGTAERGAGTRSRQSFRVLPSQVVWIVGLEGSLDAILKLEQRQAKVGKRKGHQIILDRPSSLARS